MGLGGIKSAWQRQTKDFGHDQPEKYSCLVFDHRGIGESDRPIMRYSTSEMARDIIEILDHVKWTGERSLHVIGVSMGGMVSQELVSQPIQPSTVQTNKPRHFAYQRE
jgi:pimeloyl-ACP methyl ester carboxylesterase